MLVITFLISFDYFCHAAADVSSSITALQVKVLGRTTQSLSFLQYLLHYVYSIMHTVIELFIPGVESDDDCCCL